MVQQDPAHAGVLLKPAVPRKYRGTIFPVILCPPTAHTSQPTPKGEETTPFPPPMARGWRFYTLCSLQSLTPQCTSAGEGRSTPADILPTTAGLSREVGACFSLPSVALYENDEQFYFHISEKKAPCPTPPSTGPADPSLVQTGL